MLIIWVLRLLSLAAVITGAVWAIVHMTYKWSSYLTRRREVPLSKFALPALLVLAGLLFLFWTMAATYVPATQRAVVENTATGSFKEIGPGIHIWPFQPNLVPLASKVTKYNMRRQIVEIGTEKVDDQATPGVAAGSNSPGNPTVLIQARGWAEPNPKKLVQLHRKYGPDYANQWVERNWVTTVKAVQGKHPYDYLIANRDNMATEVEETLQAQLQDGGEPLVFVSQLAITNFDFPKTINDQLDTVAQKEFDRQKAEKDIAIAKEQQEAENVKADTRIQIAKKDAEATVLAAQADAEAIRIKYGNPEMANAYLIQAWIAKWNGQLPQYSSSGGATPLIQLPNFTPTQRN